LLAKAAVQLALISTVPASSRASPLPHWIFAKDAFCIRLRLPRHRSNACYFSGTYSDFPNPNRFINPFSNNPLGNKPAINGSARLPLPRRSKRGGLGC